MQGLILICIVGIAFVAILFYLRKKGKIEGYKDPIWIDRSKLQNDYYTRSNGSIYGSNCMWNGYWDLFSGFPVYPRAY
jgi:hypothetical protein